VVDCDLDLNNILLAMFFSVSGLRGIVGKDLTPDLIRKYLSGFYQVIGGDRICIGRDSRRDSSELSQIVSNILTSFGGRVTDVGVAPTPTVLLAVRKLGFDGGIIITASHNPYPYNGLKFVHRGGRFFFYHEIKRISEGGDSPSGNGEITSTDGISLHLNEIVNHPLVEEECRLKVGIDPVNGSGCMALKSLLGRLGCKVFAINDQPTGIFSRPPEPTADSLSALSKVVEENRLDIGFGLDPDGDRLSIVDEQGVPLGEEYTLPLLVNEYLDYKKGPVVVNLSTSRMTEEIARDFNVPFYRARVGEANVVEQMLKVSAVIGGEGNGGLIIPEVNLTRDAILAAGLVVSLIRRNQTKVSELVRIVPKFFMRKERLSINLKIWKQLKSLIAKEFHGEKDTTDGIRITNEKIWIHLRLSRTEPVVRLIVESQDRKMVEDYIHRVSQIVRSLG